MPTPSSLTAAISVLPLLLLPGVALAADDADAGAPPALQPAQVQVAVNGEDSAEPLVLLQDGSGGLYVSAAALAHWRVRPPAVAAPVRFDGDAYYRIEDLPGVRARFSAADQALSLELPAELFERQRVDLGRPEEMEMTPAGTGAYLNYDVFAQTYRGSFELSGVAEAGLFTPHGVGASGFVFGGGGGGARLLRLDTSWTIDRPGRLATLRLGDSITAAGPGTLPLRFGGIRYARNFAMRPGFLTMPLPTVGGSAALPSVVDIYVDNNLQGSRPVGPGPFELADLPVQTGAGTVRLVVRDLLGRQVVTEQSYYASASLLRRGLHDFSFELGFLRRGFGARSDDYGAPIASSSHRYGLTSGLTLEAQLQATPQRQSAGGAANLALFDLAVVGVSAAVSRSDDGVGTLLAGYAERRGDGFSFGVRAEAASAGFRSPGDDRRPARLTIQGFADWQLGTVSLGANILHRERRGGESDDGIAGVFANFRLDERASVQLFARRAVAGEAQTVLGAHVHLALGGRRSLAATVDYRGGRLRPYLSMQQDPPVGLGGSYRVTAAYGDTRTVEAAYAFNGEAATLRAQVNRAGGGTGVRVSASGAIGLVGGRAFASRSLGSSFALVQVGGHAGVRVYADNQLVGTTGADGRLVVPSLRAYERNAIRIDEADLPLDTRIADTELTVRPFARAGSVVRFAPWRERGVLLRVTLPDGRPVPAGATVRVDGDAQVYLAATGGDIYLPDLAAAATLRISWDGQGCGLDVAVPEGDDPQPRLELVCRPIPTSYAGHDR